MKTIKRLLLTALVASTSLPGFYCPAQAEKVLQGQVCEENVHKLTSEIDWCKSLHQAQETATAQGKLILWVHMVGKIDGAT